MDKCLCLNVVVYMIVKDVKCWGNHVISIDLVSVTSNLGTRQLAIQYAVFTHKLLHFNAIFVFMRNGLKDGILHIVIPVFGSVKIYHNNTVCEIQF